VLPQDGPMPPKLVLVADDDPEFRFLLTFILATDPTVGVLLEARNGEEAIDLARRERPDVLVTDIMMPRLDGLAVTRQIKREWPETKVVVVSAATDYRSLAYEHGADEFVSKREVAAALLPIIQQFPGRAREADEEPGGQTSAG
jgi:DNA-binding NarL/FixJ family response regulator